MEATTNRPIVGVFDDAESAQLAVKNLRALGLHDGQIGVLSREEDENVAGNEAIKPPKDTTDTTDAASAAATGAATGAGIGALWGLGILAGVLPGIGPAIAGGTLGVLLSSAAAAGAAGAGIGGALLSLGLDAPAAKYYEGEFASGKTIVTVDAGFKSNAASRIIEDRGGIIREVE